MMSLTYVTKKLEDQTLEEGELGSQKVKVFFSVNIVQKNVSGVGKITINLLLLQVSFYTFRHFELLFTKHQK